MAIEIEARTLPAPTPRQRQVLELLVNEGSPNKEIAKRLGLGEGTIKVHMAALMQRYGVHSRAGLAAMGAEILAGQFIATPQSSPGVIDHLRSAANFAIARAGALEAQAAAARAEARRLCEALRAVEEPEGGQEAAWPECAWRNKP